MENSITVKELFLLFERELKELYPKTETDQFVYILLEHFAGWSKIMIHEKMNTELSGDLAENLSDSLEQLKTGKPVQYITGIVDFGEVKIRVSSPVLIPRQETEQLVELIWRENRQLVYNDFSLLDIGTGSGCIPISLGRRFKSVSATGFDFSEKALAVAKENALLNKVSVSFVQNNILDETAWKDFGTWDFIISNPPYVPESEKTQIRKNVLDFEPHTALFVPDSDPLIFYRKIAAFAFIHLSRPGTLYFEIHENFGKEIKNLLFSAGFEKVEILKDLNGKDRFARAEVKLAMADQSYWHVEH